jgi:hypothetical protein
MVPAAVAPELVSGLFSSQISRSDFDPAGLSGELPPSSMAEGE